MCRDIKAVIGSVLRRCVRAMLLLITCLRGKTFLPSVHIQHCLLKGSGKMVVELLKSAKLLQSSLALCPTSTHDEVRWQGKRKSTFRRARRYVEDPCAAKRGMYVSTTRAKRACSDHCDARKDRKLVMLTSRQVILSIGHKRYEGRRVESSAWSSCIDSSAASSLATCISD